MSGPGGAGLELRVLEALDAALAWPETEREARLDALAAREPVLAARLGRLLAADGAAAASLPTQPPEALAPHLPPPERVGVYKLTALLGEGGMGSVWRGERDDGLFEQSVAIKLMRPGLRADALLRQFAVERRVLARLRHPNIAQLFDGGADPEGRAWFAMEMVDGGPLTERIRAEGLSLRQAVERVIPVCAAVQHAHAQLVVHADIKPGNILLDGEGHPKLLDFGIARNLQDDEETAGYGLTPAYASPARRAGERPTTADDVYALGALLWELAEGRPPPAAPPPPCGPHTPAELAAVIAKACAAEPVQRYDGAGALALDLRRWLDGQPVRALPDSAARSTQLFVRRRPLASTAGVAGLVGLVVALGVISALYLRSEAERREAERRFAQARGMAHYMLFDLFDRLNDTPGTLPARRELVDRARIYLDDLSAAKRAPVAVRAEAAIGYMQLAGVEGLFTAGQLGERGRVASPLQRAEALLAAAPASARHDPDWLHAQGRLKLFEGFRIDNETPGDPQPPVLLREAVELLRRAAAARPGDVETLLDLWQARLTLAEVLGGRRDYRGDLAVARQALAAYADARPVLDRHAKTPLFRARTYKVIGGAIYYAGDRKGSLAPYAQAEAILTAEDRAHPRRSRTLMELMDARWNLGSVLAETGDNARALPLFESALAAGRERLRVEPDHEGLRRMTTLIAQERASLLAQMGRNAEALAAAHESLETTRAAQADHPGDPVLRRAYLAALRPVGEVEAAAGDATGACGHFREALAGYLDYMRSRPLPPQLVQGELVDVKAKAAACR